ncbi:MAG TPA: DUF1499 domain-containing protein [Gemmatimonadales bacterium]|jgi:uncharacterized protein (DUF1499 family)|nr:DUF1499 domain-containing protein [Gemmatimonadales bacterium]
MTASPSVAETPLSPPGIPAVVVAGVLVAVLCAVALIASGFGYRLGWWGLRGAFTMLRWSAYGGGIGALVSLAGTLVAWRGAGRAAMGLGLLGVVVGLVVIGVPWSWLRRARSVPGIHDITTDTEHPPAFVAVLPLRVTAPNKPVYGGAEVAAQQLKAYPDVKPILLPLPPPEAFAHALAAARGMGWDIVATDSAAGRIEATATTFWYGFKDDVVIRVTPGAGGARIDVRSESRVGGSDVGTNAERIRAYTKKLTGV